MQKEWIVSKEEVDILVNELRNLESRVRAKEGETLSMKKSGGQMKEISEETYRELTKTAGQLANLVQETAVLLEQAGISFEETDRGLSELIRKMGSLT